MTPLPPLAAPETASVPADLPHLVSRDTLSQSISRALNQPVRVVEMDDGDGRTLIVEPLHIHRVMRRKGRDVVCKSHVHGGFDG